MQLDKIKAATKTQVHKIPAPKMRLYGVADIFFNTEEELDKYLETNKRQTESKYKIEFLGSVAGRNDVIRLIHHHNKELLVTAVDEDGYGVYNPERSIEKGYAIWEYHHGDLRDFYKAFRDRKIPLKNDIYAEIDTRDQHILEYCRKNNFFHMGKKTKQE